MISNNSFEYSKKGKRKLTPFQSKNLLFDYINSNLDSSRNQALSEEIKSNLSVVTQLKKTKFAIQYLDELSKIQPNESQLEQLKEPSSYMNVLLAKINFSDWSVGLKMGFELLILAVGVISISIVIPWHRVLELRWLPAQPYILAIVEKSRVNNAEIEIGGVKTDGFSTFPDEGAEKRKKIDLGIPLVAQLKFEETKAPEVVKKTTPASAPKIEKEVVVAVKAEPKADEKAEATSAIVASAEKGREAEKRQGFLYRGTISVTNVEATAAKFVEKIAELGGRKAGEVELGWKKGSSAYFHLTMPEAKYQNFMLFAADYGNMKLQKEKHDRIMPDGIIRIIFTIDEKK